MARVSWSHVVPLSPLQSCRYCDGIRWGAAPRCRCLLQGPHRHTTLPEVLLPQAFIYLSCYNTQTVWPVRIFAGHILINRPARRQTHACLIAMLVPRIVNRNGKGDLADGYRIADNVRRRAISTYQPSFDSLRTVGYFIITLLLPFAPIHSSFLCCKTHTYITLALLQHSQAFIPSTLR